jgi:hypothetical protein
MSSLNKPAPNRHFISNSAQCQLCDIFTYSADFKANLAGSDSGDPKCGLTLTFAHSRLQRLGAYWLVRKYPKINLSSTMQEMGCRNPTCFNLLGAYPTGFQRLQAVFAKRYKITSRSPALHLASLALSVFNPFRHRCHFFRPLQLTTD